MNKWLIPYTEGLPKCMICYSTLEELEEGNYFLKTVETRRGVRYVCKHCYTGNRTGVEKRIRRLVK